MPKKTKKQKIKNKERRQKQQHISQISPAPPKPQLPDPAVPLFSFTGTSTVKTPKEDKTMYSYSTSDLKKTTILAILFIGILIALSFFLN
jgi:hypothetical protein